MADDASDPIVRERFADRVRYERAGHVATFLFGREAVGQGIDFLDRYLRG